jgi:putative membrane protein
MAKQIFLPAFAAVSLAAAVHAADPPAAAPEFANPTFANPDTPGLLAGKPAGNVSNTADIAFLQQLAIGGRAEVALGKLASERGTDAVKKFGTRMTEDHGKANSRLSALARSAGVTLPAELDAEHEAARRELAALQGSAFDLRYAESQIKDHQKAVELLIHEIGSGQHGGVREFAAQTLPVVMQHLEHAREMHAQLVTQSAARATAAR